MTNSLSPQLATILERFGKELQQYLEAEIKRQTAVQLTELPESYSANQSFKSQDFNEALSELSTLRDSIITDQIADLN